MGVQQVELCTNKWVFFFLVGRLFKQWFHQQQSDILPSRTFDVFHTSSPSLPSLASLYTWRYKRLGSLPHVLVRPEFRTANAGFQFEYQLINVRDFNGVGESEPNPYFYQVSG